MDAIIISPDVTTFLTTSITIPAVWVASQMCHPVSHLDLPQLLPLPMFLPHLGPPYLPPAKPPPSQHKETQPVATLPTLMHVETNWTSGSSISLTPPSPTNSYPYYKKALTLPLPPHTPHRCLHHGHWISIIQATYPGAEEFRSDVNRLLKHQQKHNQHCNLTPAQCRALTQLKQEQQQGGSHSRQGGGYGYYGPTGLQQQGPGTSTRYQHIQSSS